MWTGLLNVHMGHGIAAITQLYDLPKQIQEIFEIIVTLLSLSL